MFGVGLDRPKTAFPEASGYILNRRQKRKIKEIESKTKSILLAGLF